MADRLRVLISAYACEPGKGSEPEVGWQWAMQMARFHDVTVLTRTNNRAAIESELTVLNGKQPVPRFVYHDRSAFAVGLKRRFKIIKLYYLLWQKSARAVAARLHETYQFDLMHHVTFAAFRYPTAVWGHGAPVIWGPVGGIESIPARLLPWRHPISLWHEGVRNISNLIQAAPNFTLPQRAGASTLILASTREMQQTFAKLGFESELMPTIGLHTEAMPHKPHRETQGPLKLLFVGNIITLKGLDLALDALKESATNATLTIVGSGNYLASAQQLARDLGLLERVEFRARLPREEVLKLYADFDAFIFPSLHDTGGYAVIEAMVNELPVICLDCGGPAVAVRAGCGVKVPLRSRVAIVSDLAAAIRTYDADRVTMLAHGKAARKFVLEEYDWDKKGIQMNERYRAVAARGAGKQASASNTGTPGFGGMTNLFNAVFSLRGAFISGVVLLMIGALGFVSMGHLKQKARQIVQDTLPGLSYAGEANASLAQAFNRTLMLFLTDDARERNRLKSEVEQFSRKTTSYLESYRAQIYASEDLDNYRAVVERRAEYFRARLQTIVLLEQNRKAEALQVCKGRLLPAFQAYKNAADMLFEYNMREGRSRGEDIMTVCGITQVIVGILGMLVFVGGFVVGMSR